MTSYLPKTLKPYTKVIFAESVLRGNVNDRTLHRLIFEFYYNNKEKKYKILMAVNKASEPYISEDTLSKCEHNISCGADILALHAKSIEFFFTEHLNAMYTMIGDRKIKNAFHILNMQLNDIKGDIHEYNYRKFIEIHNKSGLYTQDDLDIIKRNIIRSNKLSFPVTDIAKNRNQMREDYYNNTSNVKFDKDHCSFNNINFVFTVKSLLSQFKWYHRFKFLNIFEKAIQSVF